MTHPALDLRVARMLLRKHMAALRNYPRHQDAEDHLARTVQECSISVEHAEEFLRQFDDECPTPREIKDAARNARERICPEPDPRLQWEKECGPPQPFAVKFDLAPKEKVNKPDWPACGTAEEKEMFSKCAERLGVSSLRGVHWGLICLAAKEQGYFLTAAQRKYTEGWTLPPKAA